MRRHRSLLALVGGAIALLLAACGEADDPEEAEPELAGAVRSPALQVGDVSLPEAGAAGAPFAMRAPAGELLVVYFGYTSCPDVCPTTMSDLRVALEALPPDLAERVAVAMVTVDPERDTGEVLAGYLDHFFERAHALRTEDPAELSRAADTFGVQWEVEAHAPGEAYDVGHTAITYVVDDTGTVAVEWPFGFESTSMTADITTILERTPS